MHKMMVVLVLLPSLSGCASWFLNPMPAPIDTTRRWEEWRECIAREAPMVDDRRSDAYTVALGVKNRCSHHSVWIIGAMGIGLPMERLRLFEVSAEQSFTEDAVAAVLVNRQKR